MNRCEEAPQVPLRCPAAPMYGAVSAISLYTDSFDPAARYGNDR